MAMVGPELYIMGGIGAHTVFLLLILILFQTIIVTISHEVMRTRVMKMTPILPHDGHNNDDLEQN